MAASLAAASAGSASARLAAAGEVPGSARPCCPGRLAAASFPCAGAGRRRRPAVGVRCGGGGGGSPAGAAADAEEGGRFVGWFREAWPYIRGHRGSTFVVVISGEVVAGPHLDGILQVYHSRAQCLWSPPLLWSFIQDGETL